MEEQKYKVMPVIRRLIQNIRKEEPKQLQRVVIYTLVAAIYPFLAVFLPKIAIGILEQGGEQVERNLIITMLIYFAVAGVIGFLVQRLKYTIEVRNMHARICYLGYIANKTMGMDYKYVEDASFWEKNQKALGAANNNSEGIEGMYNHLYRMPANIITLIGMILLTAGLSPFILVALVLHVVTTMWISKKNHDYRYARRDEEAKELRKISYFHKTSHDFTFGKDIRIYNFRERIMKNYQTEIESLTTLLKKFAKHEYILGFAGIATLLITNVFMYGILIYQTVHGMPISSFSMYVSLITTLMTAMITFGEDITFLRNQGQYVGDAFRLMEEQLEDDGKEKIEIDGTLEIVFDHVDFHYPGSETYIYKDLNFTIHKGERLAIVGINGAGKSTLVKLMTGLFEPTSGHIYINGIDISKFRKKDLYDLYSAVFQDVNVLAFPIRENVAGATKNVDDERVQKALEKVGLWEKVSGFEKGLDQMMLKVIDENGTDFSGGERQKLSIARGLYKDAPMVIMDEPTAALDALAEAAIYENFSSMVEGKTAVYVSHRLASTKFCDKIALFDKDGVKEYGTHDELMKLKGEYYHMFTVQGKYYQEEEAV